MSVEIESVTEDIVVYQVSFHTVEQRYFLLAEIVWQQGSCSHMEMECTEKHIVDGYGKGKNPLVVYQVNIAVFIDDV